MGTRKSYPGRDARAQNKSVNLAPELAAVFDALPETRGGTERAGVLRPLLYWYAELPSPVRGVILAGLPDADSLDVLIGYLTRRRDALRAVSEPAADDAVQPPAKSR